MSAHTPELPAANKPPSHTFAKAVAKQVKFYKTSNPFCGRCDLSAEGTRPKTSKVGYVLGWEQLIADFSAESGLVANPLDCDARAADRFAAYHQGHAILFAVCRRCAKRLTTKGVHQHLA